MRNNFQEFEQEFWKYPRFDDLDFSTNQPKSAKILISNDHFLELLVSVFQRLRSFLDFEQSALACNTQT